MSNPVTVYYEVHSCKQGNMFLEERRLADLQSRGKSPIAHDRINGKIITEVVEVNKDVCNAD